MMKEYNDEQVVKIFGKQVERIGEQKATLLKGMMKMDSWVVLFRNTSYVIASLFVETVEQRAILKQRTNAFREHDEKIQKKGSWKHQGWSKSAPEGAKMTKRLHG